MYLKNSPVIRARQGDIYRNVVAPFSAVPVNGESDAELEITEIEYPYAVVLSQECDLEQDFTNRKMTQDKQDKFLPAILFAPAYLAQQLKEGIHLEKVGLKMERINSANWKISKQNRNLRYHFLKKDLNFGVPDLAIDFKHYFTISRDVFCHIILNDQHYVASLGFLFREDLSNRFSHYLSRIGLPLIEKPTGNFV
ncbi:MAG: hypothetical protein U9N62_03145 [Thermotogota bacterium]|nr:hypothetical protein [Thermotogota bacterium]